MLAELFGGQGDFAVEFAQNGEEALHKLRSFQPDVVTLDVQMPRMDGLACLDRIMLERPCPVVMVSSLTQAGAEATLEALALGAGMNARGVIEVIVAMVGLRLGVLNDETYTIIVLVAIVTSLMAPPILRFTMNRVEQTAEEKLRLAEHDELVR